MAQPEGRDGVRLDPRGKLHGSGGMVEPFVTEMNPRLHDGSPILQYPWDDDRGFQCVKRVKP